MPRPLLFSAFVMNTTSHILHGVWRRPDARQIEFNSLELWVNLAKELEAGKGRISSPLRRSARPCCFRLERPKPECDSQQLTPRRSFWSSHGPKLPLRSSRP